MLSRTKYVQEDFGLWAAAATQMRQEISTALYGAGRLKAGLLQERSRTLCKLALSTPCLSKEQWGVKVGRGRGLA